MLLGILEAPVLSSALLPRLNEFLIDVGPKTIAKPAKLQIAFIQKSQAELSNPLCLF